jgi:hypothetical protein
VEVPVRHSFGSILATLLLASLAGCLQGGDLDDARPDAPPSPTVPADAGEPGPVGPVDRAYPSADPAAYLPYCAFDVAPDEIRFGIVDTGASATLEFAIENPTDTPCQLRNFQLCEDSDKGFTLVGGPYAVLVVPAGGEARIALQFSPAAGTCHEGPEGCLEADVGPGPDDHRTVALDCPAPVPASAVLIAPDQVDFGEARPACTMPRRSFDILDIVSRPVTIEAVELAPGTPDAFVLLEAPAPGTVIQPGLSATVTLGFRPEDAGPMAGTAVVRIAEEAQPIEVPLQGGGIGPATWRDAFEGSGERACFALANQPEDANGNGVCSDVEGELAVRIDGEAVASTAGGEAVWSYDTTQDAVCFAPGHVPADGARVEVEYRIACLNW